MSIRSAILAAAVTLSTLGAVHANGLRPIQGESIHFGEVSGVTYYTVEPDGFRVVTTIADGQAGTPVRFVSVLAPGQHVVLSTSHQRSALEISRSGDSLIVRKADAVSN